MKKIICLILTICFIALTNVSPFEFTDESKNAEDSFVWDICSISDFSSQLEAEHIDVDNSEAYNIYMLVEAKNVLPNNTFAASNISLDSQNVDDSLKEHRENVENYYSNYNANIASVLGLEEYTYHISYYSPYIEIVFDDLAEYEQCEGNIIASVENNKNLLSSVSSYAQIKVIPEATVDDSSYTTYYPIIEAFDDIGVLNSQYTGNGVNVGIIDVNIPHITDNLKPGKYTMLSSLQTFAPQYDYAYKHGTVVTSIIGGTSGIAENVHFYCLVYSDSIIEDCNTLIKDWHVNIINMSLGFGKIGRYTKLDACVDHIVSTTGCTFVKSSGNQNFDENGDKIRDEDQKEFFVTNPGCSLNAITVGSMNYSHNLADSSCWNTLNPFVYKPDVVAPGGWLSGLANFSGTVGGTSCSAPMVTGTIALLMEEFPTLKGDPDLVKSIVHLGAEKLPSQSEYFDQQAGFGLINYQNMRECLLNSNYANFSILPSFTKGSIVLSHVVTIPSMKQINVNANLIFYTAEPDEDDLDVITPIYTDYSIRIYDFESSSYVATSTINSTMDYLSYTNTKTQDSMFRIDIVVESSNTREQTELGSIAYEICDHVHVYYWEYLNQLLHQNVCACGATGGTGRHYVTGGNGMNRFVPCAGCGYLLDMRDDIHEGIMSITQVSVNGSYIRSDGIVVLVDEDIEAYLAGTLQFYHPEDIPVTQ